MRGSVQLRASDWASLRSNQKRTRGSLACEGRQHVLPGGFGDSAGSGYVAHAKRGHVALPGEAYLCEISRILCQNLLKFITFAYELRF